MLLPRDGIAMMGDGPILGPVHGSLLAMTSHHPWWLKPNPNTKKIAGTAANSGNAGKSKEVAPAGKHEKPLSKISENRFERYPMIETAKLRTESLLSNALVWRASKSTCANLAEIAGIARISKTAKKQASAATLHGASEIAPITLVPWNPVACRAAAGVSRRRCRRPPSRSASPAALRGRLRWCGGRARRSRGRAPAAGSGSDRPGSGPNSAWAARSWAGSAG